MKMLPVNAVFEGGRSHVGSWKRQEDKFSPLPFRKKHNSANTNPVKLISNFYPL
jgi:hypothetical protein